MKKILIAIIAFALVLLLSFITYMFYSKDETIATVNGHNITISEFKTELHKMEKQVESANMNNTDNYMSRKDMLKQQVIMKMVDDEVLKQKAESLGIKGSNVTNALADKYMKNVKVSNNDINNYYNQHKKQFIYADVYLISVKDGRMLNYVQGLLKSGMKFQDAAQKYSNDLTSAGKGGLEGNFPVGFFSTQAGMDLSTLKPGEISKPVKTKDGYRLYMVQNITQKSLNDVKDIITSILKAQAGSEKLGAVMQDTRKQAKVRINWSLVYGVD